MENKKVRVSLSTVLLFISILIIMIMGYIMYNLNEARVLEVKRTAEVQARLKSATEVKAEEKSTQPEEKSSAPKTETATKVDFNKNLTDSLLKEMKKGNLKFEPVYEFDYFNFTTKVNGKARIVIDNKLNAILTVTDINNDNKEVITNKKIAENVVSIFNYEEGQSADYSGVLLLKKDGTVTYIGWNASKGEVRKEETVKGLSNIVNVIPGYVSEYIDGESTGGGFGLLFVQQDGTVMPLKNLDLGNTN